MANRASWCSVAALGAFRAGARPRPNWTRAANGGKPLKPWRLHDLRRSAATGMAEIGILPHVIEAALNHVSDHKSGVAGVYNQARYEREMRVALGLWAEHVLSIVQNQKC